MLSEQFKELFSVLRDLDCFQVAVSFDFNSGLHYNLMQIDNLLQKFNTDIVS